MPEYTVTEDQTYTSHEVTSDMFGTQFVTSFDHEFADDSANLNLLASTGTTVLRFPGGSITEEAWTEQVFLTGDWETTTNNASSSPGTFATLNDFFGSAAQVGATAQLVIPTRVAFEESSGTALYNGTFGQRTELSSNYFELVRNFLDEAFRLANENGVEITRFEIGNEFWGSGQMSAAEYGHLSAQLSSFLIENYPQVEIYMQISYSANFFSPNTENVVYLEPTEEGDFIVHRGDVVYGLIPEDWISTLVPIVGNGFENNQEIADAFIAGNGDVGNLSGIISHVYFGGGFDQIDDNYDHALSTSYQRFLDQIGATDELDYLISEWSPRGENSSGLQYAHTIFEAFFEMVSNEVDQANFWPTTFGFPGVLGRTLIDTGDGDLTFGGVAFSWLSATIGMQAIFDYEIANVIDIHGFQGEGSMTFLVSERSGISVDEDTAIEFSNFVTAGSSFFVTVTQMTADDGSFLSDEANPSVFSEGGYMVDSPQVIFDLDPWGVALVEVTQVTEGNDTIAGTSYSDRITGGGGNDDISGGGGNDVLNGQFGDDLVVGGGGDDIARGGWGDDTLDGGDGNDRLIGGFGADTFVFGADSGSDSITDFDPGLDRIDLSDFSFDIYALAQQLGGIKGFDPACFIQGPNTASIELQQNGNDVQIFAVTEEQSGNSSDMPIVTIEDTLIDELSLSDFIL